MRLCDIIIPTFDNINQLVATLESLKYSRIRMDDDMFKIIVINNGKSDIAPVVKYPGFIEVIEAGENLGWEGGLKLGLEHSDAPLVIFANDDIRLLEGKKDWFWSMASLFNDPKVGAVGPCSNFVMGMQNIFFNSAHDIIETKFLIGFFLMIRREALDKVGGIDDTLPGGDDIDLSIRLRDAGYRLICRRDLFVYHHGSQTGKRVYGDYWNSNKMQERTNHALIVKHGMYKYWDTISKGSTFEIGPYAESFTQGDIEGEICRKWIKGEKVLELGCGGRKTVANSIGVDLHKNGSTIPYVTNGKETCLADLQADVSKEIPIPQQSQDTIIARHILEHCQDTIEVLTLWNGLLKYRGRLIIAVPNQALGNTILMNPEHRVSFTPSSLKRLVEVCGFKVVNLDESVNGVSFVMVLEKYFHPHFNEVDTMPLMGLVEV